MLIYLAIFYFIMKFQTYIIEKIQIMYNKYIFLDFNLDKI